MALTISAEALLDPSGDPVAFVFGPAIIRQLRRLRAQRPPQALGHRRPEHGSIRVGRLLADPAMARAHGDKARAAALARYGLARFLEDWDRLLEEVAG